VVSVSVLFRLALDRVGTMRRHVAAANRAGAAGNVPASATSLTASAACVPAATATLREHGDRTDGHHHENAYILFHYCLQEYSRH